MAHEPANRTQHAVEEVSALQPRGDRLRYALARVHARLTLGGAERGDVPGWVLVTLMTAGLVVALWAVAGPLLTSAFEDAIKGVNGP